MKLCSYIRSLTPDQMKVYAEACNTTSAYMQIHLLHARKTPRPALLKALAFNSGGNVTELEVLQHFGLIGADAEQMVATEAAA